MTDPAAAPTPSPAPSSATAVELRGVTLAYGQTPVLQDLDLDLPTGAITALVGPNGSGKSTLLNAIAGLLRPARGTVRVLGEPPSRQRRRIAYVQQRTEDNKLLPISSREVVAMGRYAHLGLLRPMRRQDRRAVDDALSAIGARDIADRQLRELSGGQQQRVLIAQGLAQHGDVLLLDEPVTGLDLVSRDAILDVVRAQRDAGAAVIMTTHDLADARTADVVVLLAGRLVAAGPPARVLSPANLAVAYGRQPVRAGDELIVDDPHHPH